MKRPSKPRYSMLKQSHDSSQWSATRESKKENQWESKQHQKNFSKAHILQGCTLVHLACSKKEIAFLVVCVNCVWAQWLTMLLYSGASIVLKDES